MNTIECIKTRRSIRSYNSQPVDRELLTKVVEAASYAPSWKNTQVTRYIAIDNKEVKDMICDNACPYPHNADIIRQAPVLVVTTMVRNRSGYERDGSFTTPKGKGWQMYDCGIAGQTFCLAAHEYGLSTLIMGIFDEAKVSEILNVPEDQEVCALIAVGYTDTNPDAPKRKTTDDLLKFV